MFHINNPTARGTKLDLEKLDVALQIEHTLDGQEGKLYFHALRTTDINYALFRSRFEDSYGLSKAEETSLTPHNLWKAQKTINRKDWWYDWSRKKPDLNETPIEQARKTNILADIITCS